MKRSWFFFLLSPTPPKEKTKQSREKSRPAFDLLGLRSCCGKKGKKNRQTFPSIATEESAHLQHTITRSPCPYRDRNQTKRKKIVYEEPSRRRKCHQKRNKKTKKTCLCVHFHAPSPSFLPPHSVFILFFSQIRTPSRVAEYTRSFFRFPPCSVVSFFIDVVASLLLLFLSFFYAPRSASLAGDV